MNKKIILILAFFILLLGITFYFVSKDGAATFVLGEEFSLEVSEKAKVENLTLTFFDIVEDSRCPEGAVCVWEGTIEIKVSLETEREKETVTIDQSAGAYTFDKYSIEIVGAQPLPSLTKIIPEDEYLVTLKVSPAGRQVLTGEIRESTVTYFTNALRKRVITRLGWPENGFTSEMFLDILEGLETEDFAGVETEQGAYQYENSELIFKPTLDLPLHSAADAISTKGMRTLLENLSLRTKIEIKDSQSIITLIKFLKGI